jgi:hypothetical protein
MASFVAFDLLRLDGDDLRQRPLEKRREALMRLVAKRHGDAILFSEPLAADGAVVFAKACESRPGGHRVEAGRQPVQERSVGSSAKNPDFVRT